MKKNILSGFYFAIALSLNAQNVEVGFKPKDSAVVIDSIRATNLNTNQTVKLIGSETLTLVKITTGIGSLPINSDQGQIFPNPCDGIATICFSTPRSEEVNLQMFNASGQLISNKEQLLEEGQHRFSLQLPGRGIYYLTVQKGNESINYKVVSIASGIQSASISYVGNEQVSSSSAKSNPLKSAAAGKTINYTDGNNIMYTIYSGKNIRVIVDQPTGLKTYEVEFYDCIDKDGNSYKTVTIGTQTWMAENLKTTKYNDNTDIPNNTYSTSGGYCNYDNLENNAAIYGRLYNWYTVNTLKLAPAGWHVPTDAEWTKLTTYLGGQAVAGGKLKEIMTTHWNSPNAKATNEFGFSALPGGSRTNGVFGYVGNKGCWWSSTANDTYTNIAWARYMFYNNSNVETSNGFKDYAYSVRCVKD